MVADELVQGQSDECADAVHDDFGPELGISDVAEAPGDEFDVAEFVLVEFVESGLDEARLVLDGREHRLGVFDGVRDLPSGDDHLDEVVDQVAAGGNELLTDRVFAGSVVAEP